jgi:rubredoxin
MMNNPKCSHCGYELDEEETWHSMEVESGDGDISELTCPNLDCGKVFHVMCRHDINWKSCDEDGDDII